MKNEEQKSQALKVFRLPGSFEELKDKLLELNHSPDKSHGHTNEFLQNIG